MVLEDMRQALKESAAENERLERAMESMEKQSRRDRLEAEASNAAAGDLRRKVAEGDIAFAHAHAERVAAAESKCVNAE